MDLVLLHGWGVNNKVWQGFAKQFSGTNTVLSPCLYEVASQTSDNSFLSIAKNLNESLTQDCVVIAWSMGGLIATYLSSLNKNIKAIVFISTAPRFTNKEQWTNTIDSKELEALHNKLLLNPLKALDAFSGLIAHGDRQSKMTLKHLRNCMADESRVPILSSWLYQLKEIDLRDKFALLKLPTYVLLGKHDALIDSKISCELKKLNEYIEYRVLSDCGHAPFISKEKESKNIIDEFLSVGFN